MAGEVRVTGDLPTREVDGLEARAHLLHGLVTGQRAERVDVVVAVDAFPQDLGATTSEGVLLDDGALELGNLLGSVFARDALPPRVGVPVLLDFRGGAGLSDVAH
ncbi:Uncharacterised protein [Mycobacteroides abscessus subsp. abscessus]|nr:Uncharacterised protein [Mycobacteroides abscessus subsp. abscessus]